MDVYLCVVMMELAEIPFYKRVFQTTFVVWFAIAALQFLGYPVVLGFILSADMGIEYRLEVLALIESVFLSLLFITIGATLFLYVVCRELVGFLSPWDDETRMPILFYISYVAAACSCAFIAFTFTDVVESGHRLAIFGPYFTGFLLSFLSYFAGFFFPLAAVIRREFVARTFRDNGRF